MIDAAKAFGFEKLLEVPQSSNGRAMGACASCGEPVPLRKGATRLWCHAEACRKAAGALRAKELRERRRA